MVQSKMTAQDKIWQAESDARTLAEATVIKTTPIRLTAAVKVAKTMAETAKKEAVAMRTIAKITRSTTKKAVRRGKK